MAAPMAVPYTGLCFSSSTNEGFEKGIAEGSAVEGELVGTGKGTIDGRGVVGMGVGPALGLGVGRGVGRCVGRLLSCQISSADCARGGDIRRPPALVSELKK